MFWLNARLVAYCQKYSNCSCNESVLWLWLNAFFNEENQCFFNKIPDVSWNDWTRLLSSWPHLFVFHLPVFLLYIDVPISVKCVRNYASNQYFRLGISKKKGWMGEIAVVWWQKDPQRGWCTEEKEWWCIKAWHVEKIVLDMRQYWHFLATGRGFSGNRWAVCCYQASWKLVYKGRVLYRNTVVMRNDVPSNRNTTRCCYWYNDWLAGWGVDCSQIKIEVIFHLIY